LPLARFLNQPQIAHSGFGFPEFPNSSKCIFEGVTCCGFILGNDGEFEQGGVVPIIRFAGAMPRFTA
jgi:hypothetical protein